MIMEKSKVLYYDGSFNGFLTAVFVGFHERLEIVGFRRNPVSQSGLFVETKTVHTEVSKAKKVWEGIERKSNTAIRNIYFSFLSEAEGIESTLYRYIQYLFWGNGSLENDQIGTIEQKIMQLAKVVGKEKNVWESQLKLDANEDPVYIAEITPKHNVVPLISRYFRYKYPRHPWIIFDAKRNYGVYYDMESLKIIDSKTKNWHKESNHLFTKSDYRFAV